MKKQRSLVKHAPEQIWIDFASETDEKKKANITKELVEKYYPLVKKIAFSLANKLKWHVSDDELSSFGVEGLYTAIKRYDMTQGVKFEYYAKTRIRGSMLDGLRKEDTIPRSVRINHAIYEETKFNLESELERKVTEEEVIEKMGINKTSYMQNTKKFTPTMFASLYGITSENNGNEEFKQDQNENLIDKKSDSPGNNLKRKEFLNKLIGKNFSKTEQTIIYLYYYCDYNMDKISKILNFSESRVSQIHRKILPRLKDKILRNPKYFGDDIYDFIQNL